MLHSYFAVNSVDDFDENMNNVDQANHERIGLQTNFILRCKSFVALTIQLMRGALQPKLIRSFDVVRPPFRINREDV